MASWTDEREDYEGIAREVCGHVRLTTKDHWFWRVVSVLLFVVSLGRFDRQRFMREFASTLGPVQAYPKEWPRLWKMLVVHESQHSRQFLFAGWFVPFLGWLGAGLRVWAGLLPMAVVYGFFPVPVFFAWGRFRLELDADSHAWKVALEKGWMTAEEVRERAAEFAGMVSSWAYLKPWPTAWTRRAFARRAEQVIAGHEAASPTGNV